ncbi:prenyltransferase [Haloarcula sp. JP-Z28]|jgi:4-hydroxybenzoate polyprenyltransferase|uniref:Prenyltransferase n=1 Tax=Haloarcula marismortui ATCC 33800 TaxID=662476 RepID=M0JV64_9EURY|nr:MULTISPECIES: prenyltransferase [Haloarcula]EMA13047.1 prenyltransferase [Haloarcula sinaiiensis ATCC 33800]NHN64148.1 prenyltransferase [Haloarcula sp. JP-Z28]QUJ70712.1 prenyltransferase [Haloarcula sinaiiensis ATCC 33800]
MPELPTDRITAVIPPEETLVGYLLRLSRPRFWLYLGGPVIVGVSYAADGPGELFSPLAIALFLYFTIPGNVFLYGVNDIFDADIDEHNPKKDEGREVSYRGDSAITAIVVASGALALLFVLGLPTLGVVALLAWIGLSIEYSAPPLRFKTTPFLDSISNGLYILPGVIGYAAIEGVAPPATAVAGAWLWAMGMHTFSAIPDIEPDREAGIQTTATFLGESNTYYYCVMCWLTAAFVFTYTHWVFGLILLVYPGLVFGILGIGVDIDEAYWWYPAINTVVGMVFTLIALWVMLYG